MATHVNKTPTLTTERVKAFSTLAGALVLTANALLAVAGLNPLPFTDTEAGTAVSTVLMLGVNVWAWWKNQNVTPTAVEAKRSVVALKTTPVTEESPDVNVNVDEAEHSAELVSETGFDDITEA